MSESISDVEKQVRDWYVRTLTHPAVDDERWLGGYRLALLHVIDEMVRERGGDSMPPTMHLLRFSSEDANYRYAEAVQTDEAYRAFFLAGGWLTHKAYHECMAEFEQLSRKAKQEDGLEEGDWRRYLQLDGWLRGA